MTVMSIQKDEGRPITHPQHEGEGKDTEGTGRMHDKLMFGKDPKALWDRTHFWVSILEYLLCGIDPKSESYRIMWCNHHWDLFLLQTPYTAKNVHGWHWVRSGCPLLRQVTQLRRPLKLPRLYELHEEYIFCNHHRRARKNVFCLVSMQWNFDRPNTNCMTDHVAMGIYYERWNLATNTPSGLNPLLAAQEPLLEVSRSAMKRVWH